MKKMWTIMIVVLIFLAGCSNNKVINQLEYGKSVHTTLAWNNKIYEITNEKVSSKNLLMQIGKVKDEVSPRPTKNGDVARNTSEGPQIVRGEGRLYEIKGTKQGEQIAIELSKGEYFKCIYFGELK
jgi:hypothetical protein